VPLLAFPTFLNFYCIHFILPMYRDHIFRSLSKLVVVMQEPLFPKLKIRLIAGIPQCLSMAVLVLY